MTDLNALYLIPSALALTSTFLRSVQNKSVAAGYTGPVFLTGAVMCACDLAVVRAVALTPTPDTISAAAIGAGVGWVLGMKMHDYLTRNKRKAEKKAEKEKLKRKVIKWTTKSNTEAHLGKMFDEQGERLNKTEANTTQRRD